MVDGIIQQVFNSVLKVPYAGYEPNRPIYTHKTIEQLQHTLIERIKKEYWTKENHTRMIDNRLILLDLIGDTKE